MLIVNCVKTTIAPKASRLADHEKTKGHSSRVNALRQQCAELCQGKSARNKSEKKRVELELAFAIACHWSTASVDHVAEIVKRNGKGSDLENIQLHGTKCSILLSKVISPALR